MLSLALLTVLQLAPSETATASAPPARPKLLVLDVKASDMKKNQVESLTSVVTARAAKFGQVDVTSAQDVRELVQMEAEKQSAGCATDSCLAEIAGAMGAQYVFVTRVSKIGSSYVVSVQLYDALKGTAAARETANVDNVDDILPQLSTIVDTTLTRALGAPRDPPASATSASSASPSSSAPPNGSARAPASGRAAPAPDGTLEKNSDWTLLLINYVLCFIPIPGLYLLVPLAQGLVTNLGGEQIANNAYPYWWVGTLAGYGMGLVAAGLFVGGYVVFFGGLLGGTGTQNAGLFIGGLLGGVVLVALGGIVALAEPAVAYFLSTMDAQPLPPKPDKAARFSAAGFDPVVDLE